jgi:cell division protein FtsZ
MSIDDTLGDEVRVTVIAAGFDDADLGRHDRVGSVDSFQTLDEEIRQSDAVSTSTTTDIPVLTDQFDANDQYDLPRFFRG